MSLTDDEIRIIIKTSPPMGYTVMFAEELLLARKVIRSVRKSNNAKGYVDVAKLAENFELALAEYDALVKEG